MRTTPFGAVYLKYKRRERGAPGLSCANRCLKLSLIPFLSPVPAYDVDSGLLPPVGFLPPFQSHGGLSSSANACGIPERADQLLAQSIFQTEVVFDN